MQQISHINILEPGRVSPSPSEREQSRQDRLEREKEQGYQLLVELGQLGEIDRVRHLADQHPQWIIDNG